MNITREDMPDRQVALTIELEPETVSTALDRAYRQMVNQVNVPGFRRGKAPRAILERYVGKEMLTEQAVKNILPQTVQDAIAEQKLEALDVSDFEIVSMDPLQVKVVVVQPPKVELGDYSGIRVEREQVEITPEKVDEVMLELRREGAPWNEPAEPRPIVEGDMVYVDLEGFTTAGELPEVKREDFPTLAASPRGGVPEVVANALVGMSVGEEKDIADTLPDDYPNEMLRGHDVTYHVTVRSIKEQQLPELDEEFAKSMNFETVDALRETVERNLRQRSDDAAESDQVDAAVNQLVEGATVEAPDMLINEELDEMLKSLENRLKEQRIALRQYFTFNGVTEAEWREANRERARERVTRTLVLQEFARREGISVDEEEVEGEINQMLDRLEVTDREQARSIFSEGQMRHGLEDHLYQRKIVDRVVGIAEGRIVAAPPPAEAESSQDDGAAEVELQAGEDSGSAATTTASDLENAGGAAELLGTGDVRSENETGEAEGGGTPSAAPGLDASHTEA